MVLRRQAFLRCAVVWFAIFAMHGQARAGDQASLVVDHRCVDDTDKVIPAEMLDRARTLKILFGHESVGMNLVQGLESLSDEQPRYRLEIGHAVETAWFTQHSGLGEFFVRNANNVPAKTRTFEDKLASGTGAAVNVASLKLCWADLQQRTDVDMAFSTYVGIMEKLRKAYPKVQFVYWSMPLRKEAMLQEKRTRFNLLMNEYVRKNNIILFDIAEIECHAPDGTVFRNETGQKALFPGYTEDGGHLNAAGRARVARAWWWLMARLAGWEGPKK